jgi:hypothetical protein
LTNPRGVVDFLGPYDLGFMVWPVFNLADVWVVIGTLAFALSVGTSDRSARAAAVHTDLPAATGDAEATPPSEAAEPQR